MGLDYEMVEAKGPLFPKTIQTETELNSLLAGEKAAEQLTYVYDAVSLTKKALNDRVPLIDQWYPVI